MTSVYTTYPLVMPPNTVLHPEATFDEARIGIASYVAALEKRGVHWSSLPQTMREDICFATSVGGLLTNGARMALRNLVLLDGLSFARMFLTAAAAGAERMKLRTINCVNPYAAQLEWLDLVGDRAADLLDDYSQPLLLLGGVELFSYQAMHHVKPQRERIVKDLTAEQLVIFEAAEARSLKSSVEEALDKRCAYPSERAAIFAYVISHPDLLVPALSDLEAAWDKAGEDIRKSAGRFGVPKVPRSRGNKTVH